MENYIAANDIESDAVFEDYENFKNYFEKRVNFPKILNGRHSYIIFQHSINIRLLDFKPKTHLHYVRIYFDTPTFETISMDQSAKFEDMLSAIGGTLGLLTGFSLISGVEFLYFVLKIFVNMIQRNVRVQRRNVQSSAI